MERRDDVALLSLMLSGQKQALAATGPAIGEIAAAASLLAQALRARHKVVYCGAGSSGLIALTDAVELPGTFGIDPALIGICLAGGTASLSLLDSSAEDDAGAGAADISATGIGPGDCLIAVSASGSTPYTLAAAAKAASNGAEVIALCCQRNAPLSAAARIAICLLTGPELVAGSTRMAAGTAQKAALNMLSTLTAIRLGLTLDGQMVGLRPDNAKLRRRAVAVVAGLGGCAATEADRLLAQSAGSVPLAILMARGAGSAAQAAELLAVAGNELGRALERLNGPD